MPESGALGDVLAITTALPRDREDYAGRFVLDWAHALAARGATVRFVAPTGAHCPFPLVPFRAGAVLGGAGAPELLAARPLRAALSGLLTTAALGRAARAALRPGDRVVAHWLLPAGIVACGLARPLVYAHGGDVALLERLPGGRHWARFLDRRAHTLAFVSAGLRDRFAALLARPPRGRHVLAPMGVPEPDPDPAAAQRFRALAGGRPIVASVGRLVPIKGYDQLPAGLAGQDAVWLAAGDGPEAGALARAARAHGVELHLLGRLGPRARDALLSVAAVFAQPSRALGTRTEGRPVAVMEALLAGLPVVARGDGPVAALLPDRRFTFTTPAGLATALAAALAAPAEAREQARQAGARCRWSVQGDAHAALLPPPARTT